MLVEWHGFTEGNWTKEVNVRDFIQKNYTPYEGNAEFLAAPTEKTQQLWHKVLELMKQEREKGVLDVDTKVPTSITAHAAGYIDRDLEQIVGLQTDRPLKRAIMPYGGIRVVKAGLEAYGYQLDRQTEEIFTKYRKTHNDGVFDVYTRSMRLARRSGIITGLPDAYGRGRIIGDYRRVALYGVDRLIDDKKTQQESLELDAMDEATIRLREELSEQIRALFELKEMAASYGFDIGRPAANAREAVQWVYFGYLGAVKEQNGAAMSLGRVSTFLDIYFERDLQSGASSEQELQELIDHFVMKLRMVRFLRTPDYNALFSGDPTWVTEAIGGTSNDGRTLVTRNSFRFLHTLSNLGTAPEPNLTVLWSENLPENFKEFCAKVSSETSSIQYENDDLMRPQYGDDYAIACCVSAMRIGKQMQFFGARVNLAKTLLYAINGGKDEKSGDQIAPQFPPITTEYLDYDEVRARFQEMMAWLAKTYINTLNVIHYMHDKYCYERLEMALHDRDVYRTMACGIAGLSVVADSLSAIKHAKVKVLRNEQGLAVDYSIEGEYPKY
ncbi:MAG: formate acetyltransferase, partial [Microcoleus sp. Co-bin12]|nr:formate acetyltransferase [Microcoleus sp. Co-bin12]